MASASSNSNSGKGAAEEPSSSSAADAPYDPREYQPPHPDDRGGTMTCQWQACFLSLTVAVLGLAYRFIRFPIPLPTTPALLHLAAGREVRSRKMCTGTASRRGCPEK